MNPQEKRVEKVMAEMCINSPGYLDWDPDTLWDYAEWRLSVEDQMHDDLVYHLKGYV